MKSVISVVAAALLLIPAFSFAGEGGHSGGGGDPTDLFTYSPVRLKEINTELARLDQVYDAVKNAPIDNRARENAASFLTLSGMAVTNIYKLMRTKGYDFGFQGDAPSVELLVSTLKHVSNYRNIQINNSLTEKGSSALFYSSASNQTIQVNLRRVSDLLLTECAEGSCQAQTISALLATVFHESLVLNRIETSRSYRYSSKFKAALEAALLSNELDLGSVRSLIAYAMDGAVQGATYHKDAMARLAEELGLISLYDRDHTLDALRAIRTQFMDDAYEGAGKPLFMSGVGISWPK